MTSPSHLPHISGTCQPYSRSASDKSTEHSAHTTPSSSLMLASTSNEILPPFRTISQIAAGGRDDPNGELWRYNMKRDLPQPLVVPPADSQQSMPSSPNLPVTRQTYRRTSSEGHSPQGSPSTGGLAMWVGREQAQRDTDCDQNSDTYAGSETSSSSGSDDASLSADSPSESSWESFVAKGRDDGNYVVYECRWTGDDSQFCGYTAKRQLVKRHVEDKHLRIKRYECSFCGRRFAQKSSCHTHENSHTGAKPHPCFYHCGKWFSDPSKRTRHAYKVHAMKPKQRGVDNS